MPRPEPKKSAIRHIVSESSTPRSTLKVHKVHLPVIMQERSLRLHEPIPTKYLRAFKDMWKDLVDPGIQRANEKGNESALD